jgi:release factor glutamine methyltransferase
MNANSKPKTQTVKSWLDEAANQLTEISVRTARLDSEIILAHTLRKPRTWLHAHGDELISLRNREISDARLALRLEHVPIAYIIGHKDFYGRTFHVSPAVLVPRPESEAFFSILQVIVPLIEAGDRIVRVVDVGTGSGIIGITTKLEYPEVDVTLLDISTHALNVARKNAERLDADVTCIESNLLASYPFSPDIILANLPYVDAQWELSPELIHEPDVALFADDNGLGLIVKLIRQSSKSIQLNGFLLLEADTRQHESIIDYAEEFGFSLHMTEGLVLSLQKKN